MLCRVAEAIGMATFTAGEPDSETLQTMDRLAKYFAEEKTVAVPTREWYHIS